ncbi:hypothetical protein LEP1GSC202_3530 [Leptospira yanagawae serovar Saopaulo str. Sao Paulo = ATCC 700523]|uniref:Uncharacterized protein n=1 Tax=Leptospira yanagawae serovar Saopaulo str. Sao Paulo = ATCC 700523 TaxID=1249483 RepID=A0A5E8H7I7_9LEPT|nr:hypothetical protein LEP1GSC202_3530 [Leptospira yanagawae serovar Saopaulo str. Sao Paulo = ATCC 700523]
MLTQASCQSLTSRWDSGSGNFGKSIRYTTCQTKFTMTEKSYNPKDILE